MSDYYSDYALQGHEVYCEVTYGGMGGRHIDIVVEVGEE